MHIAFFCQYYPPETNAPATRTHEHAKRWAAAGHILTVVTALPNHPDGVVPPEYRGRGLVCESRDGVEVYRTWLFATPNKGRVLRSISFATFMLSSFITGVRTVKKPDLVVGTSPQLLCALSAYLVSLAKGVPFILEVRDLWPQQIIDLGVLRNPLLIRLLESLEMHLYKRARHIVVVADAMREKLTARGVPPEKISVVPNGVDPDFFAPTPKGLHVRKQNNWEDQFVAMYIGTLGLSQGLETLLDAAALLAERDPEVLIVLAGAGAEQERLLAMKEKRALNNVEFVGSQPKEHMPAMYCSADCCLVPLKNLDVFKHTIPSKIFEIMSCARPIILGVEGQSKKMMGESGAGVCVAPGDANALAEAILRLKSNPDLCGQLGESGRKFVSEKYGRDTLAKKYIEILESVLK